MDLGKMTDEQLIELLREGKTEITDYLMEKYKDMVRKQARAMYLWGGENDDLIQEPRCSSRRPSPSGKWR